MPIFEDRALDEAGAALLRAALGPARRRARPDAFDPAATAARRSEVGGSPERRPRSAPSSTSPTPSPTSSLTIPTSPPSPPPR